MNGIGSNPGGSGGAGGWSFQAHVTAYVAIHVLARQPLGWLRADRDVPVAVQSETGGPGDDLRLQLESGRLIEIQVRRNAQNDAKLWDALLRLAQGLEREPELVGVLLVGPSSGKKVREHLRNDLDRLAQGRIDHLKPISEDFLQRLDQANLDSRMIAARLHIVKLDLEDGSPSLRNAIDILSRQISDRCLGTAAWGVLADEGLGIAALRGEIRGNRIESLLAKAGIEVSKDVADASALLSRYSRWNSDRFARVELPGLSVELPIEQAWPNLECVSEDPHTSSPSSSDVSRDTLRDRKADAFHMVLYYPTSIVVGGPGSGKTTLLRRLTQQLSREGQCVLHIELQCVAKAMQKGKAFEEALLAAATDGFETENPEVILASSKCLVADGLDECGAFRGIVAERLEAWRLGHLATRVVASTRFDAHAPGSLSHWTRIRLLPLETQEIEEFTRCLLRNLFPDDAERVESEAGRLIASWKELRSLDVAASSPLILTFLLGLSLANKAVPPSRGELYREILTLLENAQVSGRPQLDICKPRYARHALRVLGFASHSQPMRASSEILTAATSILQRDVQLSPAEAGQVIEDALAFWREKRVLVMSGDRMDAWSFVHPTFGEYTASEYLAQLDDEALASFVDQHAMRGDWDDEFLLASELGSSSAICPGLIAASENSLISTTAAVAVRCFSLESGDETTRASIQSLVRDRLQSHIPVICYEIAEACLENSDMLSILGPATAPLCESGQYWTRLCAATICLESDESLLSQGLIESLYEEAGNGEDAWPWRLRDWRAAGHCKSHVESRFIGRASRFLLDVAPGSETYARLSDKLSSHTIGWGAGGEIMTLLRNRGLEDVLKRSEYFKRWTELWANMAKRLAGTSDERCTTTDEKLLEAVLRVCEREGITPAEASDPGRPLLALGALFSAAELGKLPWTDFTDIAHADSRVLAEVLRGCILAAGIDLRDLADDVACAVEALASDPEPLFFLLPRLTCDADWDRVGDAQLDADLVLEALHSESYFVAYLGCRIVKAGGCPTIAGEKAKAILGAGGYGLWAASVLATDVWGGDAFAVIAERLRGHLTEGCRYLYKCIPELIPDDADLLEINNLLIRGVRHGSAPVAVSAAKALADIERLTPEEEAIRELLAYWKEHEAPYPVNGGIVPPSPRSLLLKKLSEVSRLPMDELRVCLSDDRTDVRDVACSVLGTRLEEEPENISAVLQKVGEDGEPLSLLQAAVGLPVDVLNSAKDALLKLFNSRHPSVRRRMLEFLPAQWLTQEEALQLSEQRMADGNPRVRNSALFALRRLTNVSSGTSGRGS